MTASFVWSEQRATAGHTLKSTHCSSNKDNAQTQGKKVPGLSVSAELLQITKAPFPSRTIKHMIAYA
jgi:hypothetical protein